MILTVAIMLPLVSNAFDVNLSSDKKEIKLNDEIILKVKMQEKVIAANFEINYNSKLFEFIEGININAAEKNGKVACIYGDLTGKGQDEFLIKFKAIKENQNSEFKIENIKVREINKEESYLDKDITGENSVKISLDKKNNNIFPIIISIFLILVFVTGIYLYKKNKSKTKKAKKEIDIEI